MRFFRWVLTDTRMLAAVSDTNRRSASAFVLFGVAWGLLVPFGLWTMTASRMGRNEAILALGIRGSLSAFALWSARSIRRRPLPVPPVGLAAAYVLVAVVSVFHGVSKAAAARSALGFLKLGGVRSEPSMLFPDFYFARYMDGPAELVVMLAAFALVATSVYAAVRVARARLRAP